MVSSSRPASLSERGQVLPLAAVALWLVAGFGLLVTTVAARAVEEARAQAAADAVALAAAVEPTMAREVADANGATLSAQLAEGRSVQVRVVVGGSSARAAARLEEKSAAPCHQYPAEYPLHFWLCRTTPTR